MIGRLTGCWGVSIHRERFARLSSASNGVESRKPGRPRSANIVGLINWQRKDYPGLPSVFRTPAMQGLPQAQAQLCDFSNEGGGDGGHSKPTSGYGEFRMRGKSSVLAVPRGAGGRTK